MSVLWIVVSNSMETYVTVVYETVEQAQQYVCLSVLCVCLSVLCDCLSVCLVCLPVWVVCLSICFYVVFLCLFCCVLIVDKLLSDQCYILSTSCTGQISVCIVCCVFILLVLFAQWYITAAEWVLIVMYVCAVPLSSWIIMTTMALFSAWVSLFITSAHNSHVVLNQLLSETLKQFIWVLTECLMWMHVIVM